MRSPVARAKDSFRRACGAKQSRHQSYGSKHIYDCQSYEQRLMGHALLDYGDVGWYRREAG
jgi:hypothetical protein